MTNPNWTNRNAVRPIWTGHAASVARPDRSDLTQAPSKTFGLVAQAGTGVATVHSW
jgi:hypothetical protein